MNEFVKITALTSALLLQHMEFSEDDAEKYALPNDQPADAIKKLIELKFFIDATKLLAHALPKRESVWWACLAVRKTLNIECTLDVQALEAAEAWARSPTEENRLLCRQLAESLKFKTPASWAAIAASWCAGSLAPKNEPEVSAPEYLYAQGVAGAINLAAVAGDLDNTEELHQLFLKQGFDLARGGNGQLMQ